MRDLRALATRLRAVDTGALHVVTLPDFFLDHMVPLPAWREVVPRWEAVHGRGGGNVPTLEQRFVPGGNAANTALALVRLGVRTHLVTRTSQFGRAYLTETLGRAGVDLKHVRADGQLSVTTALEFHEDRPANVMLSDPGSVAQFGPESLDANDWTLLSAADLVLVANWSQNRRGSELIEAVARATRASGTMSMLDAGDPSARVEAISELATRVVPSPDLDIFALNENELRLLTGRTLTSGDEELVAARAMAATRPTGILDLHTASMAASFSRQGEVVVPTFKCEPLRVTGAGDVWNAGNIVGHLTEMPAEDRLHFANAVAALYIGGKEGTAPTLDEVARFLETEPPMNGRSLPAGVSS